MRWKSTGETSGNALTMENRGRQRERGKSPGIMESLRREDPNPEGDWNVGIAGRKDTRRKIVGF
jgi:hypothetical protein